MPRFPKLHKPTITLYYILNRIYQREKYIPWPTTTSMSSNTQSKDICDGQIHSKSPVLGPSRLDAVSVDDHRNDRTTEGISKPKRNACIVCRKKKLRCDGGQPSCDTCTRLKHDCAYKDGRRKSGPRRGYVRSLETRLGGRLTSLLFWNVKCARSYSYKLISTMPNSSDRRSSKEAGRSRNKQIGCPANELRRAKQY